MATDIQRTAFINQIGPLIKSEALKRGYNVVSPIIAQACIESNFGQSLLSSKYHNYFGLKCGSSWKGRSVNLKTKEEYTIGTLTTISDNFRVYDSMLSGVSGYFDFIATKRYENLKSATTPEQYLQFIKADGYATSSSYVRTCMNCITLYKLTQFDGGVSIPIGNPYKQPTRTLKRGMSGEDVKWLQYKLVEHGYNISIDGVFGSKTEASVKDFQTKKFVDGIVGDLTVRKLMV